MYNCVFLEGDMEDRAQRKAQGRRDRMDVLAFQRVVGKKNIPFSKVNNGGSFRQRPAAIRQNGGIRGSRATSRWK